MIDPQTMIQKREGVRFGCISTLIVAFAVSPISTHLFKEIPDLPF